MAHGCYGFLRSARMPCLAGIGKPKVELAPSVMRFELSSARLFVGCGDGSIEFLEVQLEGKKRMDAASFLNGFPIEAGEVLA